MVYAIFVLPSYLQRHRDVLSEFMQKHGIKEDDLKDLPSDEFLQKEFVKLNEQPFAVPEADKKVN